MYRRIASHVAAVSMLAFFSACASQGDTTSATLSGTATYRERMALPADAVFEATLEDVSRADAPAVVLGRTRIESPGNPPIAFTIQYDAAQIESKHRYGVRARIVVGDQLMFTSDGFYPLLDLGASGPVQMMLRRASGSSAREMSALPASFAGDLPCADCEAMRYHLDLFPDGAYFRRIIYLGKSGHGVDSVGKWQLSPDGRTVTLTGDESFERRDDATLRKLDRSGNPIESTLNYDLTRQATFAPIEPALALRGTYVYVADAGTFTECNTGIRMPVAREAANPMLEAAYSRVRPSPGAPVFAAVDGRIAMRIPMEGAGPQPTLVVTALQTVGSGDCATTLPAALSTAALENTYWKLSRIGEEPVTVANGQREPHLILQSPQKRIVGFGGCNRMTGSYSLEDDQLTFVGTAGTMMACVTGMDTERAFHDVLGRTFGYRISGERLTLLDADGKPLAEFESRYLE